MFTVLSTLMLGLFLTMLFVWYKMLSHMCGRGYGLAVTAVLLVWLLTWDVQWLGKVKGEVLREDFGGYDCGYVWCINPPCPEEEWVSTPGLCCDRCPMPPSTGTFNKIFQEFEAVQ